MASLDDESKALFTPDRGGSCRGLEADGPATGEVGGGGGDDLGRGGRGGGAVPAETLAEDLGRGGGEHALGLRGGSVSID